DAVDRSVQLTVAGTAEPVSISVAGPHRCGGGAVVPSERRRRTEALHASDLADQLRRGERADPVDLAEGRRRRFGGLRELATQLFDSDRELTEAGDEVDGDPCDHAVEASQAARCDVEVLEG